jgi:hypothetical protein
MKDFFLALLGLVTVLLVLFGLGILFNVIDLSYLGWRTNAETHITRQTNAYLTAHQTALRGFKAQYDDLERQAKATTDTDLLDALQRTAEEAEKAVAAATEQVIKEGGTVHEESLWDANEMALDGVPTDIFVRTIQKPRKNAYRPRGTWRER